MKIAAETVLWGNRIENLPHVLDLLVSHGCEGVEFSQRPEYLGDPQEFKKMLADYGLTLVGLSGGTLRERMKFCGSILRPEYLYVEGWDDSECRAAIAAGFTLALHPHLFKPVHRLADAEELLKKHDHLRFLPDTAHFTIAGDSISQAVLRWRQRLAAVHIKDWTPLYGRSSHRYARGFVELGEGVINFDMLFDRLRRIKYGGWLVFEQGNPESAPEKVVGHATRWLAKKIGAIARPRNPIKGAQSISGASLKPPVASTTTGFKINVPEIPRLYSEAEEKQFLETMFRAAIGETNDYYSRLTGALGKLLKAKLVIICACSPASDMMSVLGVYPTETRLEKNFMDYRNSLSSVALERQVTTIFDLTLAQPAASYGHTAASFGYPKLISRLKLRKLISVPVLNPCNPHQARFVVNIFPEDETPSSSIEDLSRLGSLVAQAADAALDERCALAAATASVHAGQCQQSDAFLEKLRDLLLDTLRCEALSIFLVNDVGNRLEESKSTGLHWNVPSAQQFYRLGEDLEGGVWERREALISSDPQRERGAVGKSSETKLHGSPSFLCAPMVDVKSTVIGVIRCQNKRSDSGSFHMFSEDDLAVLDTVCQAAVPHLQVLLSKERRAKALRRLSHELQNPLVALRGATDRMKRELLKRHGTSEDFFSEDYIGDIESWVGLMRGLLGNADFFRLADQSIMLEQRRVLLYGDVFMPAVNQIQELLMDRHFESDRITIPKFTDIPAMWLDKHRLTQVVFNLFSNAIKYSHEDPKRFRILVAAQETDDCYQVNFSDHGLGIAEEIKEAIFLEGVRSKGAEQQNVGGDGLGLWVCRRLIEAHGGTINVSNCSNPTTFTILLPKWLTNRKRNDYDLREAL